MAIDPSNGLDERRFAGAIGSQEADELAFLDLQVRTFDDLSFAVANFE
jgi:hypothetical protein